MGARSDNLRSFGTPSYYVQKVFATNLGTRILPVSINGGTASAQDGLYAIASLDERSSEVVVKVVNTSARGRSMRLAIEGAVPRGEGRVTVLANGDLQAENSVDAPTKIAPVESRLALTGSDLRLDLQPQSLTVLRLPRAR